MRVIRPGAADQVRTLALGLLVLALLGLLLLASWRSGAPVIGAIPFLAAVVLVVRWTARRVLIGRDVIKVRNLFLTHTLTRADVRRFRLVGQNPAGPNQIAAELFDGDTVLLSATRETLLRTRLNLVRLREFAAWLTTGGPRPPG